MLDRDEVAVASRWPWAEEVAASHRGRIRILSGASELTELFRLRYRRYVVEQGKQYDGAVDAQEMLLDPVDRVALNIAEGRGDRISAAVRLCLAGDVRPEDYLWPLRNILEARFRDGCMICSRLVVDPPMLGLRSTVLLFRATYEIGLRHGGELCGLSTRPELVPMFAAFGYERTGDDFFHEVSGHQVVLILRMRDIGHLERTKSPLAQAFRHAMTLEDHIS